MRNPFEAYNSVNTDSKSQSLDWDETAADTQSYIEDVYDSDRTVRNMKWLWLVLVVVFCVLGGRMFHLQVVRGNEFRALSENNRIRRQTILAPRGKILDRYNEVLAQNTASYNLVAIPFDLPKEGLASVIERLSVEFELDKAEVAKKINSPGRGSVQPVLLKQDISLQQSILFETKASEYVGFSVQEIPIREYPNAKTFSHVLGYSGLVSPGDLEGRVKDRYDTVDFVGKTGIEIMYEDYLHGVNGQSLIEVDATGKLLNTLGENPPLPGSTVTLNIDKGLQQKLYEGLGGDSGSARAAAVALNPKNGQVLALVSLPGFDNNLFAHGIKNDEYQKLLNDKNLPLYNRAISGTYPPGSTIKPAISVAALEEGVVNEDTIINDRGVLVIPNQFDPAISYNFYGWKRDGLGPMDVRSAIAESSDIYFYTVAGGHPSSPIVGLGAEKLAEYYRKFNLGRTTGIDLQGERPGVVADPKWKEEYYANDAVMKKWYLGNTYHIAIGQGDMLSTPLQVAQWTAIIANNGVAYKPHLLNKVVDSKGRVIYEFQPQVSVNKFASDKNLKIVQEGMRQAITAGSGRQLLALPITSAGKTGTSQFDGSDPSRTHAWFTAYAPFENPEIVITVLVEAGGEGHAAAVPVVKEALKWWAENRYGK